MTLRFIVGRILRELIELAERDADAELVDALHDALLTGDEDIRVGVQQAQEYGVRVHVLGIKPARGSQSILIFCSAVLDK